MEHITKSQRENGSRAYNLHKKRWTREIGSKIEGFESSDTDSTNTFHQLQDSVGIRIRTK